MTIDFESQLNPAQLEAARALDGPVLVIAGAGSGKTRTIVHRLANLVSQGVPPESILLLTFTRKASQEMLDRAEALLGMGLGRVQGGTFHSFAYSLLRRFPPAAAEGEPQGPRAIMDRGDAESLVREVRGELGLGKGDRAFPKAATVLETLGKARNKEQALEDVLSRDAAHLLPYLDELKSMAQAYAQAKRRYGLLDYDDLLFELEALLRARPEVLEAQRRRFSHIMVDEYQDTNLVQGRLVKLLAGERGNVMAVGDDAQSIYAFRGANIHNILSFPKEFLGTRVIRLERNYRSTQPILDLTNKILEDAPLTFRKHLYTEQTEGPQPLLLRPLSDKSQADMVANAIGELLREHQPEEIAVLFRAAYQSYQLEICLNKRRIAFSKVGGQRYVEAAHVKDALSFLQVAAKPENFLAWRRMLGLAKGVGPKTADKLFAAAIAPDTAKH